MVSIARIKLPVEGIEEMRKEAVEQGYDFLDTLVEEWASGKNRFEGQGERLLGCFKSGLLVGVGGLTVDPYFGSPIVGRIRRVYVRSAWRNHGMGALLVQTLVAKARENFAVARLRAENLDAARLYERLGFSVIDDENATHAMDLMASVMQL